MKTINVASLGSLPTFTRTEATSDVYWTERLNYEVSGMINDMENSGFTISQPETTDVDALNTWLAIAHTSLNTFIEDFKTWLIDGGDYPTEPSLPSMPSNYDFFYKIVVGFVSDWYFVLRSCRRKQIEKIFTDIIRDGQNEIAETEGILNIGDHMVWMKSLSVDEI